MRIYSVFRTSYVFAKWMTIPLKRMKFYYTQKEQEVSAFSCSFHYPITLT